MFVEQKYFIVLLILVSVSIFNMFLGLYVLYKTYGVNLMGILLFLGGFLGLLCGAVFPEVVCEFSVYKLTGLCGVWSISLWVGFCAMVGYPLFRVRRAYWKECVVFIVIAFSIAFVFIFGFSVLGFSILLNACQVFLSSLQIGNTYVRHYNMVMRVVVVGYFFISFFFLVVMVNGL